MVYGQDEVVKLSKSGSKVVKMLSKWSFWYFLSGIFHKWSLPLKVVKKSSKTAKKLLDTRIMYMSVSGQVLWKWSKSGLKLLKKCSVETGIEKSAKWQVAKWSKSGLKVVKKCYVVKPSLYVASRNVTCSWGSDHVAPPNVTWPPRPTAGSPQLSADPRPQSLRRNPVSPQAPTPKAQGPQAQG